MACGLNTFSNLHYTLWSLLFNKDYVSRGRERAQSKGLQLFIENCKTLFGEPTFIISAKNYKTIGANEMPQKVSLIWILIFIEKSSTAM